MLVGASAFWAVDRFSSYFVLLLCFFTISNSFSKDGNQSGALQEGTRVLRQAQWVKFLKAFLDNSRSVLQYRELPNRVLNFHHTEVPEAQRSHGTARLLVEVSVLFLGLLQ